MRDRDAGGRSGLPRGDRWWLALSVLAAAVVAVAYLQTHPSPANGAGRSLVIADRIAAHGYGPPGWIPQYSGRDVPFANPPLVPYASAVAVDVAGVDPLALSRFVPAAVTVLAPVPYYFVARELLDERTEAGVATVLLAVTPPVLRWHLSAAGLVRGPAFVLTLTGLYTGVRLFRSGHRRWLVASALLFGLVGLAHPMYAVFFGLSHLLFYLAWDRSARGSLACAGVALGGLVLSAPWWATVVAVHGPAAALSALGAGIGSVATPTRLLDQFVYPLVTGGPVPLFFLLSFGGAFLHLGRRRVLLPTWLVATGVVVGEVRFQFVPGSAMAAVFLLSVTRAGAREYFPAREWRRSADVADAVTVGVAAVVLVAAVVGVTYGATALPNAHHGSPSQPRFVDRADRQAMEWVATHTDSSAAFVVVGDAAERFPSLADRTVLVGPWERPNRGGDPPSAYRTLSNCGDDRCVTRRLRRADLHPQYLYVPKGSYTVLGMRRGDTTTLRRSLSSSARYRLVYGNRGVAIYRVDPTRSRPSSSAGVTPTGPRGARAD